jgi:ABC-type transporter Mla subunit MlaD
LAELLDARAQVRRFGNNVNQAVRVLNATGEPPEALARAVDVTARAVADLDRVAAELVRRLR